MSSTANEVRHKQAQQALYDAHLLDDLVAGAGKFGFRKPKLIRDLFFAHWLHQLCVRPGDRVLDLGCNAGARLEQLRRECGAKGVGVDISPRTIAAGQRAFPALDLSVGDAEALKFPDASFDAAISFETFEHLPNPGAALAEMARVVKPGGRVLVYAISRRNALTWHWWLYLLSGGRLGAGALGDHTPDLLVPPEAMADWAQSAGLRLVGQSYFHSFFTIIYDEVIVYLAAQAAQRLRQVLGPARRTQASTPPVTQPTATGDQPMSPGSLFRLYRAMLSGVATILWWADLPWRLFRLSDGFFMLYERLPATRLR